MSYISEHKTGLIGSIITHAVILALLLFFGFFTPLPLPGEEGILVDFGDSEKGIGAEEPAPKESAPVKNQEEKQMEAQTPPPPPQKKVVTQAEKDALMTQDLEKTVALESAKKKKEAEKLKDLEKQKILNEKRKQEELEKQYKAENERLRQAEIARQKKEEDQRLAQAAAEQRKAGEINDRAKNAFGGSGKGTADSKSTGQGVTYGSGNQGSSQGTANADKYGPGGGVGNGVSFSLDGRSAQSLPKPYYPGNEEGIVVVQVTVDKNGAVKKAESGVKGSNTADPDLIVAAKKAALQARFNVDENAPAFQIGTITYHFVLN
ncbi:MAG TPA: cell envelope integrity protein TolA [Prolixibacteraceae bacterium]|nr:cell envelope integrity protein TolA [Prolixibacteraceae bacterium]